VVDSVPFAERGTHGEALDWPDFRTVDAVLAVRPAACPRRDSKPATKLCNAWLAGVPALLSPEVAYRELRRSPLDYLEVAGPEEAKGAVDRLLAEPGLYQRMVANGRERAAEVTGGAVLRAGSSCWWRCCPRACGRRRPARATGGARC
jgi:hypothetical protein